MFLIWIICGSSFMWACSYIKVNAMFASSFFDLYWTNFCLLCWLYGMLQIMPHRIINLKIISLKLLLAKSINVSPCWWFNNYLCNSMQYKFSSYHGDLAKHIQMWYTLDHKALYMVSLLISGLKTSDHCWLIVVVCTVSM